MGSTATLFALLAASAIGAIVAWALYTYHATPINLLRSRYRFSPPLTSYEIEVGPDLPGASFERLPPYLVIMVVFHEDDLFFSHGGMNWREIRNRMKAYLAGAKLKGGSSITQQVAKNVLAAGAIRGTWRVLVRKMREVILAIRLERELTKSEILSLYLQSCRLGPGNLHGFSAASRRYFEKDLSDLDVTEIAFLVSLLPAPTRTVLGIREGRFDVFPYRNLYARQRDVVRFIVDGWGWGALERPSRLEMAEVTKRLESHRRFASTLSANFEIALDLRALSMVAAVRRVASRIANPPETDLATVS